MNRYLLKTSFLENGCSIYIQTSPGHHKTPIDMVITVFYYFNLWPLTQCYSEHFTTMAVNREIFYLKGVLLEGCKLTTKMFTYFLEKTRNSNASKSKKTFSRCRFFYHWIIPKVQTSLSEKKPRLKYQNMNPDASLRFSVNKDAAIKTDHF